MSEQKAIKVGEVYMIQDDGDKFVGLEVGFTDAVLNRQGAAMVLDNMRNAMNSSGWIAQTILRAPVGEENAQTDEEANQDSDPDTKVTSKGRKKVAQDTE
jgi:hypothetical protein